MNSTIISSSYVSPPVIPGSQEAQRTATRHESWLVSALKQVKAVGRKDQIIRVVSGNLTGLIGVRDTSTIYGARTSDNGEVQEGAAALLRLLNLSSGEYDVLVIEREIITRKLQHCLNIDLNRYLAPALDCSVEEGSSLTKADSDVVLPAGEQVQKFSSLIRGLKGNSRHNFFSGDPVVEPDRLLRISSVQSYRAKSKTGDNQRHSSRLTGDANTLQSSHSGETRCKTISEVLAHVYGSGSRS